jgi:hydrogenase maturation protease
VACIGNVFLGDDGFGVEVAERLAAAGPREGVHVEDYGIRGMDLAYALAGYEAAILVDAVPRGQAPGTLYVIEPELDGVRTGLDAHGMDPEKVLALARELGPLPRVLIVGCEPASHEEMTELSEPVRAAVGEAARLVESLVEEMMAKG